MSFISQKEAFFVLICFCSKWSKKCKNLDVSSTSLCVWQPFPPAGGYTSKTTNLKTLTCNVSLLKKEKKQNKIGTRWIHTALLLIPQLPQKCWPLNSGRTQKAASRDETFHKRKCQRGDRDFSSGKGKKYEEDRGHAELLEVIISSACLLVSDADGRMRLTVVFNAGTAAGRRDERLLDGSLTKLVPKVVYTAADKGEPAQLQLKTKNQKTGMDA